MTEYSVDPKDLNRLRTAAQGGDPVAQFNLGLALDEGVGTDADPVEAAEWYGRAAEQGQAHAQLNLGVLYSEGRGVARDTALAAEWYRRAAVQGLAEARVGVSTDLSEAARYYTMAAERSHGGAQHALVLLYWKGRGVKRDRRAAMRWARMAARNPAVRRYTTRRMVRDAAWAFAILALAWLLVRSGILRSR